MSSICEIRVHMDCPGCESKIKKALHKVDGVDNVEIDMDMQKVTVTGWAEQKKILKAARKSGRKAEIWPFPYNPEYEAYAHHYYNQSNNTTPSSSTSSHNYRKHGYNGHDHGTYQELPYSTIDDRASAMFSDENVHGCAIM